MLKLGSIKRKRKKMYKKNISIIFIIFIFFLTYVFAIGIPSGDDLPIVGGDDDTWGTKLNQIFNRTFEMLNVSLTQNGTLRYGLNASLFNLNITNYLVVTGNVNITDTINATNIYQNRNQVQTINAIYTTTNFTADLSNSNASIATWTINSTFITPRSDWLVHVGNINGTNANFTSIFQNGAMVRTVGDFDLRNISNYTEYMRHSTFSLANVSNNTLTKDNNASIALWNITDSLKYIFLRDSTLTVRLGNISNPNFMNDTLVVDGNLSVYGRLNGTIIEGSTIRQNNNQVQTINAVFNLVNWTAGFGNGGNNSWQREATAYNYANNQSGRESAYFRLVNLSNHTTDSKWNESISLWNITGVRTIQPRIANVVNITGNITLTNGSSTCSIWNNGSGICICSC